MTVNGLLNRTLVGVCAFGVLTLSSCLKYEKDSHSSTSGTTTMVCDNSFENIFQQEVDVFEYQYPDAHILVRYGTQAEAFDSLFSMNTRSIVACRDITPEERSALKARYKNQRGANVNVRSSKIAVDAVAFIVNPANNVEKLTVDELGDIVGGETTNWDQIQPSERGKIKVVIDRSGSSMATYLSDSLLQGRPLGETVFAAGSIAGVFEAVEKDPDAIGVLGVSWITSDMDSADISKEDLAKSILSDDPVQGATLTQRVKVLKVYRPGEARAYKPYQQYIFDGSYPLFRQIYMITTASTSNVAGGFYSFVTGPIGQKIIMKTGILPATVRTIQVELPE
ncbi:MAG: substrate-binding domain-containing protein [Muribaculaceae bacterium]|nr:substrate-binding domain-containing protein [Muribaculaceae bacterium]